MTRADTLCFVINVHYPFLPDDSVLDRGGGGIGFTRAQASFFEFLSESCLPLLEMCYTLEAESVPFSLAFSLSPSFCEMAARKDNIEGYSAFLDRQIEFGYEEVRRCEAGGSRESGQKKELALLYRAGFERKKRFFTEKCRKNVLNAFYELQERGTIELLSGAAGHAFLPFYTQWKENLNANVKIAEDSHRAFFKTAAHGFTLPALGWAPELDPILADSGFVYTIIDSHTAILGAPPPAGGTFYPLRTPRNVLLLARDMWSNREIAGIADTVGNAVSSGKGGDEPFAVDKVYRCSGIDAGYELPGAALSLFGGLEGSRVPTGYKYRAGGVTMRKSGGLQDETAESEAPLYDPRLAEEAAVSHARRFLENRFRRFQKARPHLECGALAVVVLDAKFMGRLWYEGPRFLESVFREGRESGLRFLTPQQIFREWEGDNTAITKPAWSSGGRGGYGETWLDSSCDWVYRHQARALTRMSDLAGHFAASTGIRERLLNQAAREILLAQDCAWPAMMSRGEDVEYARYRMEIHLRNFTTIFEALGSSHVSTRWFTALELQDAIFPRLVYSIYKRPRV